MDVGMINYNSKDAQGKSVRSQLEVDFVCNRGSQRYYIQSAWRLSNEDKREQETRSLRQIKDNFKKFVITDDPIRRYRDENGVIYMNIYEFLLEEKSWEIE